MQISSEITPVLLTPSFICGGGDKKSKCCKKYKKKGKSNCKRCPKL